MFQFKIVKEVNKCLRTIDEGGVILHPTDTVYGLAGDSANNKVSIKINQIKKRKVDKPLIHLMSGIEMISDYVNNISETAFKFLKKNEPTTVIFTNINENKSKLNSIAIRIPSNDPFFKNFGQRCMNFVRSMPAPQLSCTFGYGEQMNQITHTVKKKSEIFPDYNWIAPCIPAGCGFLSHGYLSNSIWNWIQLYLDSYPTTKNDLN